MRVLKDRVIIERIKKGEAKKGSLLLPNEAPEYDFVVVDIGKDVKIDIKVGDKILVEIYHHTSIKNNDGRDLFVVKEDNIYVVL